MNIFRDPVWQFVGAIISVIAIYAAIVIYKRQKGVRKLNCDIIYYSHILNIEEKEENKLLLSFGGEQIKEACIIIFKLYNAGTVSILASDFEGPVAISFGKETRILDAEVAWTRPEGIPARINFSPERFFFRPILLNPGDTVALKAIVSQAKGEFEINGRIAGIKQIQKVITPLEIKTGVLSTILAISASWFFGGLFLVLTAATGVLGIIAGIFAIFFVAFAAFYTYIVYQYIRNNQ